MTGAPQTNSEMTGFSGRGTWLAASLLLGTELLCYFGFPVWAGLPPRHPLLPYAAFALLVLHGLGLYYVLRWWLGRGPEEAAAIPESWSWRRLRSPGGLVLLIAGVALAGPQLYLMTWPITSGDDEPIHLIGHLRLLAGMAHPSTGIGATAAFIAILAAGGTLMVFQIRRWAESAAQEGSRDGAEGRGWRGVLFPLAWIGLGAIYFLVAPLVVAEQLPHRYPPLGPLLGGASLGLFGMNEVAARLPALIFYLLTGLYVFRIVAAEADESFGVLAAVLCLAAPIFFLYGHLAFAEAGGAFFTAAAVFHVLRHARFGNRADLALAACAIAAGYLERRSALSVAFVFPVAAVLWSWLGSEKRTRVSRREAAKLYGGAILVVGWIIAPWWVRSINTRPYEFAFGNWAHWDLATSHLRILPETVGWPGVALLVVGTVVALWRRRRLDWLALAWFGVTYVFFTSVDPLWLPCRRFVFHLVPPIAVLAAGTLTSLRLRALPGLVLASGLVLWGSLPLVCWLTGTSIATVLPRDVQTLRTEPYYPFDQVAHWFERQPAPKVAVTPPAFWQQSLSTYVIFYGLQDRVEVRNPPWTPGPRDPKDLRELWERCQREEAGYLIAPEPVPGPGCQASGPKLIVPEDATGPAELYALLVSDRAEGFSYVASFHGRGRRLVLSRVHDELPAGISAESRR